MTVEDWWNEVKDDLSWSGAISGMDWEELWPEAQEDLERIFDAAREDVEKDYGAMREKLHE